MLYRSYNLLRWLDCSVLALTIDYFRVLEGKIRAGLKVRLVNRHSLPTAERIHRTALDLLVRVESSVFDK